MEVWASGTQCAQTLQELWLAPYSQPETPVPSFGPETSRVLCAVWKTYGHMSARRLREMTHREPPWKKARSGYDDRDNCEEIISLEDMGQYFIGLLEHQRERAMADASLELLASSR